MLVVIPRGRQRYLRLPRIAIPQDQQALGRDALGQHLTAQRGGRQRREPRVQRGEDGFSRSRQEVALTFGSGFWRRVDADQ